MLSGQQRRKSERCPGSGREPSHTYTTSAHGSGGAVTRRVVANCPEDHDGHYDLQVINGRVQPHSR
jgi:hypothetical protein